MRAIPQSNLGQQVAALKDLERAIELGSQPLGYISRANLISPWVIMESTVPDLTRAIELSTAAPIALLKCAMVYEAIGATALARKDYEESQRTVGPLGDYGPALALHPLSP